MPNLNKVILMGNVTRDPESRFTQNGTAIADLGIAINRTYTKDGEKKEDVTYVDVELWGRLAEIAVQYVKKGGPVLIEGRLKLDQWDDKQTGQKRSKMKVVAEGLQLLEKKGSDNKPQEERPPDIQFPKKEKSPVNKGDSDDNDDIPF